MAKGQKGNAVYKACRMDAAEKGLPQRHRIRNLLPLWQKGRKAMPPTRPAERVLRKRAFHNGTDSRNLLPLRQRGRRAMPPTRPAERVLRKRAFHNGTDSRITLPLWKNEYVWGSRERVILLNLPDKILHL